MKLKDRLALIKRDTPKEERVPRVRKHLPDEWGEIAPFVWTREIDRPFRELPSFFYPDLMRASGKREDGGVPFFQEKDVVPVASDRIAFFDLETTGLSGGAGVIAFLATVAHFEGADLVLRQTFLSDYPGERDFLSVVTSELAEAEWIASYNGATFDLPLLQTRCVLNRITMPLVRHIDVLHDCRRFWGGQTDSCSLSSMETLILKKERDSDIPGALVPAVWLAYVKAEHLREEQEALLSLVWRHNVQDVASLAALFVIVESVYREPGNALALYTVDPAHLARRLMNMGRTEEAKKLLCMVRDTIDTFDLTDDSRLRALRCLASIGWKERDRRLYAKAILAMDDGSVYGCVAKAKLYEHFYKDERAALVWALRARELAHAESVVESRAPGLRNEDIDHRIERIQRKLERKDGAFPD